MGFGEVFSEYVEGRALWWCATRDGSLHRRRLGLFDYAVCPCVDACLLFGWRIRIELLFARRFVVLLVVVLLVVVLFTEVGQRILDRFVLGASLLSCLCQARIESPDFIE